MKIKLDHISQSSALAVAYASGALDSGRLALLSDILEECSTLRVSKSEYANFEFCIAELFEATQNKSLEDAVRIGCMDCLCVITAQIK